MSVKLLPCIVFVQFACTMSGPVPEENSQLTKIIHGTDAAQYENFMVSVREESFGSVACLNVLIFRFVLFQLHRPTLVKYVAGVQYQVQLS